MTDTIVLARRAAEGLRDLLVARGVRADVLDAALAETVDWPRAAGLVASLADHVHDAGAVGIADQTASSYVDYFAAYGIDLRDERSLFQLLVTLAFLSNLGHVAVDRGVITTGDYDAMVVVLRSAGACVSVLAPAPTR